MDILSRSAYEKDLRERLGNLVSQAMLDRYPEWRADNIKLFSEKNKVMIKGKSEPRKMSGLIMGNIEEEYLSDPELKVFRKPALYEFPNLKTADVKEKAKVLASINTYNLYIALGKRLREFTVFARHEDEDRALDKRINNLLSLLGEKDIEKQDIRKKIFEAMHSDDRLTRAVIWPGMVSTFYNRILGVEQSFEASLKFKDRRTAYYINDNKIIEFPYEQNFKNSGLFYGEVHNTPLAKVQIVRASTIEEAAKYINSTKELGIKTAKGHIVEDLATSLEEIDDVASKFVRIELGTFSSPTNEGVDEYRGILHRANERRIACTIALMELEEKKSDVGIRYREVPLSTLEKRSL